MRPLVEFSMTLVCICIVIYSMLRVYESAVYLEGTTPDGVLIPCHGKQVQANGKCEGEE